MAPRPIIGTNKSESPPTMSEYTQQVASTILSQLGGASRLSAMIGANSFASGDFAREGESPTPGLSFRIKARALKGIKAVVIKLNGHDLYDVEFGKIITTKDPDTGFMINCEYKVVDEHNDIDAENLKEVIERSTGLYLSL
jgi:hypothetical protein